MIPKPDYEELTESAIQVRRMLIGLRKTLRGQPRPPRDRDDGETPTHDSDEQGL